MKNQDITIIIADDHPLFRDGLRDAIRRNTPYSILGEASDGEEALVLIRRLNPAIAILDIEMPKRSGLEVALCVLQENLPVSVIILTMYEEAAFFNTAIDSGVKGYILKETAVPDILQAISKVAAGEYYFSPSLSGALMKKAGMGERKNKASDGIDQLTSTESEIMQLIAKSLSSRDIAERLSITVRTVETHRHNIARKLGLSGSYALIRYAMANQRKL